MGEREKIGDLNIPNSEIRGSLTKNNVAQKVNKGILEQEKLINACELADNVVLKKYISNLGEFDVLPVDSVIPSFDVHDNIRLFKIESIVYDREESNLQKLLNVYHSIYTCGSSLILIIDSKDDRVDFYLGSKSENDDPVLGSFVLGTSMKGNFPGTKINLLKDSQASRVIEKIFEPKFENVEKSIAAITSLASLREEQKLSDKGFVQGMEKLIESMRGNNYTLVIIADPVFADKITEIRSGYENLYSQLLPFSSTEMNFGKNESQSVADSITKGVSDSISSSLTKTTTNTHGRGTSHNSTNSSNWNQGLSIIIANAGHSGGKSISEGVTENWSESDGQSINQGNSNTQSTTSGKTDMKANGTTQSYQVKLENKTVKVLLEHIDKQLKRLDTCSDLGMWNCAAYVIADDDRTSRMVAGTYQALIRGKDSGSENAAVTVWRDKLKRKTILAYLKKLQHPIFHLNQDKFMTVSTTELLSGAELTIAAGLPQKSIAGLPVYNFESFGREIAYKNFDDKKVLNIGKIYFMGQEENMEVKLDLDSIASHVFITGSTGTGKSNAVFTILEELKKNKIHFLVIEPAKGEYKNVFGNSPEVNVFGTNPYYTKLLRINPFKFPNKIHVLEHIDRLVEIFNVCWPMYAAMPAVLKSAIIKAYETCGWDMVNSINLIRDGLFPSFKDILTELINVIDMSSYDNEVKSNYKGSLETRIMSLTNGLNGQIFAADEIDDSILFDSDTIIDLSRVGSSETKSLIMGLLVMRLNEYRMSCCDEMNVPLRHVTVLEEAHNILRRTSTEQNVEGVNVAGKAVEMLSNAIAELRSYGDGFVIVDQSPDDVDRAAIRNTNTKIIFRLPDEDDRYLAGKAAALKDAQIDEIAKLPKGVSVVYQNEWLEPVLCKVRKFAGNVVPYVLSEANKTIIKQIDERSFKTALIKMLIKGRVNEQIDVNIAKIENDLPRANLSTRNKIIIQQIINDYSNDKENNWIWGVKNFDKLSSLITEILDCQNKFSFIVTECRDIVSLNRMLCHIIEEEVEVSDRMCIEIAHCFMKEFSKNGPDNLKIYAAWRDTVDKRGGIK